MIITITRRHEYKRGTVLEGSGEKEGEKRGYWWGMKRHVTYG
jgi:hypothetical protein